jgi:hypothetical protein
MHEINIKQSEKEIIGSIDQAFTCLASRTTQSLPLAGLEDYPMSARLLNDNWKQANKKLRNSTPNMI